MTNPLSLHQIITELLGFWRDQGCLILQPYDMEVGAGTFHWGTTLKALGPDPWHAAYVQASRRPGDGRFGRHRNRLLHYYQLQAILKPSPPDSQELFLQSLARIGITPQHHDIRFIEDDWESPTLGAWGLGWEVWCNGMEIGQFTYFQQIGGINCRPAATELTYGLERIAMYIQDVDDINQLVYDYQQQGGNVLPVSYGSIFRQAEAAYSNFHFRSADPELLAKWFSDAEQACWQLLAQSHPTDTDNRAANSAKMQNDAIKGDQQGDQDGSTALSESDQATDRATGQATDRATGQATNRATDGATDQATTVLVARPAYDYCIKASHLFNSIDALGLMSRAERQSMVQRVRRLTHACCRQWLTEQNLPSQS